MYIETVWYPSTACLAEIGGTWLPIKHAELHEHGIQVETLTGKVSVLIGESQLNGAAVRRWLAAAPVAGIEIPDDIVTEMAPKVTNPPHKYNLRQRRQ
jgi:hypothetical protein